MPRPKKRSAIAKRLNAERKANKEAAPLPLKTCQEEVLPLPLKLPDSSGSCFSAATQQVPPGPAKINGKEAAQLPLKTSRAEVPQYPLKKLSELSPV